MVSIEQASAVDDFVLAKFGNDYKQLQGGERLYHCPNPPHPDKKKSCSVNIELCVYKCHSGDCDFQGSFYQLAKEMGWEKPHLLIPNHGNSAIVQNGSHPPTTKVKKKKKPTFTRKELADIQKQNVNRLKNNMNQYWNEFLWDADLIDLLDIGVCTRGIWQIAQHNRDADIIAIKSHKPFGIIGTTHAKWYAQHLIYDYDQDKDWVLSEGELDFWTAFSRNGQVFTGTCGAKNIPKNRDGNYDLSPFKYFTNNANGYVAYDNDDTGKEYGLVIGREILKEYQSHNIYQIQWGDDCANKFDITDAYIKDPPTAKDGMAGIDYMEAIMNANRIKLPKVEYASFEVFTDAEADTMPMQESIQLVEHILVKDSFHVFGGTAGCNKSMFWMQVGMAIANDDSVVMGFKINQTGLKVAYVDTECGSPEVRRRYKRLKNNFPNWNSTGRFMMMSRKAKMISEALDDIEQFIQINRPDVIVLDCLYNMKKGVELAKNVNLSPITDRIFDMKMEYGVTPILIAHATKGNHEQGLTMDRIAGGSHLQNCAEHITLFTRTNTEAMRMLRVDKSRSTGFPSCYYGLEWNGEKFFMGNREVVDNPKKWLVSEQKTLMWSEYLNNIPTDTFTTKDWLNEVEIMGGKSMRTAKAYLREMVMCGVLSTPHKGSGIYTKNIKVIVDDTNEE